MQYLTNAGIGLAILIAVLVAILSIYTAVIIFKRNLIGAFVESQISKFNLKLTDGTLYKMLLVFLLVGLAYVLQEALYYFGERTANRHFTIGLKYATTFPDTVRTVAFDSDMILDYRTKILTKRFIMKGESEEKLKYMVFPLPKTQNCKINRIYEQITDVAFSAYNHLSIAKEFMIQSYLCMSAASIFFIIAAASLAYMTKVGMDKANAYMVILLVVSASIGTFFIGLTKIFKHDDNVANNFALYVQHINLEQSIRNKLIVHPSYIQYINSACTAKADTAFNKIILYADSEFQKLNVIKLGFDSGSIDFLRSIQAPPEPAAPAPNPKPR